LKSKGENSLFRTKKSEDRFSINKYRMDFTEFAKRFEEGKFPEDYALKISNTKEYSLYFFFSVNAFLF